MASGARRARRPRVALRGDHAAQSRPSPRWRATRGRARPSPRARSSPRCPSGGTGWDPRARDIGRTAERATGLRRLVFREERRITPFERAADRYADALVFVSGVDRAMIPSKRAITLPLGVEPIGDGAGRGPSATPRVVFSGNMAYRPNVDAATWFADHRWAQVREALPDAELWIVGGNPAPAVAARARAYVAEHHSWEHMAREIDALYASLVPAPVEGRPSLG